MRKTSTNFSQLQRELLQVFSQLWCVHETCSKNHMLQSLSLCLSLYTRTTLHLVQIIHSCKAPAKVFWNCSKNFIFFAISIRITSFANLSISLSLSLSLSTPELPNRVGPPDHTSSVNRSVTFSSLTLFSAFIQRKLSWTSRWRNKSSFSSKES
jgi:hypothetical protein